MTPNERKARELLPCPWCGDELTDCTVSEGSTFRWRKVDGCCTDGPEVRHNTMADDQEEAERDSTRRAIEAWNLRAPDQATEALRAERDAAFRMSRCECASDECCANLVKHQQRAERLAEALRDAATSMQTIADKAGRDEYLMTMDEVRGYANSRANAALAAQQQEADR